MTGVNNNNNKAKKAEASTIMLVMFQLQNSLKLAHWRADRFSQHKSLDKFLKKFMKKFDEFIEVYMGKYTKIDLGNKMKSTPIYQLDMDVLERYLVCVRGIFTGESTCDEYYTVESVVDYKYPYSTISVFDVIDKDKDGELVNIRDEIVALIDRLIYLLRLK